MEDYLIEIPGEKGKHSTVVIDNVLQKLQECISMVTGPLAFLYVDFQVAKQSDRKYFIFSK